MNADSGRFGVYSRAIMKPNHKTTFAALALLSIAHASAGDIVTLTWKKDASEADNARTSTLTLAAGESAKVKFFSGTESSTIPLLSIALGGFTVPGFKPSVGFPVEYAGPAIFRILPNADGVPSPEGWAMTFEVNRPASPSVTPSNAAVIPVDANGTFTVILESSTDLITWTAANPGDYSGNTVKRFFRTRIVKK